MSVWLGQWRPVGTPGRHPEQGGADAPLGVLLGDLDPDDPVLQTLPGWAGPVGSSGGGLFLGAGRLDVGEPCPQLG